MEKTYYYFIRGYQQVFERPDSVDTTEYPMFEMLDESEVEYHLSHPEATKTEIKHRNDPPVHYPEPTVQDINNGRFMDMKGQLTELRNSFYTDSEVLNIIVEKIAGGDVDDIVDDINTVNQFVKAHIQDAERLIESSTTEAVELNSPTINDIPFTDAQALRYASKYPEFMDCIGHDVQIGFRCRSNGVLYKSLQPQTINETWTPENAASIWQAIDEEHSGTQSDPIRYNGNMELELGRFYIQDKVLYECTQGTGMPVYHPLSQLVGLYVRVV